ncbi:energy transducer TonB [Gluconacetobacter sp. Hr-1-5]|uniref:energy transducer TonB n=1 Tax=Gluconacetobacter sp. Hr-1-5 TaxID=3395370 RepID=UPI003B52C6F4
MADAAPPAGSQPAFSLLRQARARRERHDDTIRWATSAFIVVVLSSAGIWGLIRLKPASPVPVASPPAAIAIDLAPEPVAAPSPSTDTPPGPQQTMAEPAPQPDPPPRITAPPSPAPTPPVPVARPEKPRPLKKQILSPAHERKPVPDKTPPAQETTAPPSSDAPSAPSSATPVSGAASSQASHDPVTWQGELLARLEKYKRYPAESQTRHEEGTAMLHFAMDRKGHVLSARISSSSHYATLDEETLALIHRAEPLPIPPDSIPGNAITLTVPIEFYLNQYRN